MTNIDDEAWLSKNFDWGNRLNFISENDIDKDRYGRDAIWGVNNLTNGDKLSFTTYNLGNTNYTYGYQVLYGSWNSSNNYWKYCEALAGVSGVVGAENNFFTSTGYYGYRHCDYNPQ